MHPKVNPPKGPLKRLDFRNILGHVCAIAVVGAGFYATGVRFVLDRPFIYSAGIRHVYPEGHLRQVEIFKSLVPKGYVFYVMDQPEYRQAGLWRRSLYPDNPIILVYNPDLIHTQEYKSLRNKLLITYVLSAGNPPADPGLEWKVALPTYPGSIPLLVGKLRPSDVSAQ